MSLLSLKHKKKLFTFSFSELNIWKLLIYTKYISDWYYWLFKDSWKGETIFCVPVSQKLNCCLEVLEDHKISVSVSLKDPLFHFCVIHFNKRNMFKSFFFVSICLEVLWYYDIFFCIACLHLFKIRYFYKSVTLSSQTFSIYFYRNCF